MYGFFAFVVCCDTGKSWARGYDGKQSGETDAAIAATHMMLEAASLGLGCTWVMYFIPEAVQAEFQLPPGRVPAVLLVMGYPADTAKAHFERRDDMVTYL